MSLFVTWGDITTSDVTNQVRFFEETWISAGMDIMEKLL